MKALLLILCTAGVGVVGYLVEPQLRLQLTGVAPTAVEIARGKKVIPPHSDGASPIDLASLPAAQLPQSVVLKTDVTVIPGAPELPQPPVEPVALETPAIAPAEVRVAAVPVKVMQDSIRAAEIKEFSFAQVREWQAGADETLDDQTYQTGTVTYIAPTILGNKKLRAKALIQSGKVCRWVRSNSGIQLN
jgi:hypothetical protein